MAVYIVAYDLNKETRRPKIVEAIKAHDGWAMLSESSYAVATSKSPDDVYAGLTGFLDENDQLYVITLKQPHVGFGPPQINEWLSANLTW